jgi:glutathione synthase/RimK-type ligase-like ATP-grasp enzyme
MVLEACDVVLLTEDRYDHPQKITPYVQNILTEDGLVQKALEGRGMKVHRCSWSDPDFDPSLTRMAVFRTTWDYFDRFPEFRQWLKRVEGKTHFSNPIEMVRWNMDKHYLLELERNGIPIPPTRILKRREPAQLDLLYRQTGWERMVLKPTVSGAARHTYLLDESNLADHQYLLEELLRQEDMMLQEFQRQIYSKGEVAFMLIGGKFTHAVLKKGKEGDFRVQDDFGGTVQPYDPSPEEMAFAERVVARIKPQPIYARVDVIWDNTDRQVVSEVELIEPEMWFRMHPPAAERLAEKIIQLL